MTGLNKWCVQHDVPKHICELLQKGKVLKSDAEILRELRDNANGRDGNLSKAEIYKHRLWELKIHHNSKAKDSHQKLFWPLNTPTADSFGSTRGGKGKGANKDTQEKEKGKRKGNNSENRSGGEPKTSKQSAEWSCSICGRSDAWRKEGCLICSQDPVEVDASPKDPNGEEMEEAKENVQDDGGGKAKVEVDQVSHLKSEIANCEDFLNSLPFEKNHPMVQHTQIKVQELREQLVEATKAVQQQPAEEIDLDLKAKRDQVKASLAKVEKLTCMDEETHASMIQKVNK
jgi:hypothetical protein